MEDNPIPNAAPISFNEYREIVRALPEPTQQQQEDFAAFVSNAHSWYKHLPLLPPGRTLGSSSTLLPGCR